MNELVAIHQSPNSEPQMRWAHLEEMQVIIYSSLPCFLFRLYQYTIIITRGTITFDP